MMVSQGDIVAGMYLDGVLRTFDFLPYRQKAYREFKPIDDLTAAAHYYNNLGAEALLGGNLERARELITTATRIAPRFDKAINNLGVIQARLGDPAKALETYQRGLAISPESSTILVNMAHALQQLGRSQEADQTLAKVEAENTTNPFFFIYEGEVALARGGLRPLLRGGVRPAAPPGLGVPGGAAGGGAGPGGGARLLARPRAGRHLLLPPQGAAGGRARGPRRPHRRAAGRALSRLGGVGGPAPGPRPQAGVPRFQGRAARPHRPPLQGHPLRRRSGARPPGGDRLRRRA